MANPSTTKGKVVPIAFQFDDLSSTKVRPAYCLTNPVGPNNHIILAYITAQIPTDLLETDIVLDTSNPDFANSGLRRSSAIRLDFLMTVRESFIQREIGELSSDTQAQIAGKLCKLITE